MWPLKKIHVVTSDFIIYTCLIQIQNKAKSIEKMNNFIVFMDNIGIEVHSPSYEVLYNCFQIMKRYKFKS